MAETAQRRSGRAPFIWLAQGAITLSFVGWLASRTDWTTIETITAVSAPIFFVAVLVYSLSQFWCAVRLWILIVNGEKLPGLPRLWYLVRLTLSTFFISNFLPGTIGGDVVKAIALTHRALPLSRTVSALLLDRLTNVAAALALSITTIGVAAPDLLAMAHFNADLVLASVCLFAGFFACLVLLNRFSNLFAYAVKALHELALGWLKAPLTLGAALLLSIVSLMSAVVAQWILASNLGLPVTPLQLTAVICLVYMVTLVPVTLNGIGLQEVTTVMLLVHLGAQETVAVSFALLTRLLVLASSLVGAAVTAADRELFADLRQSAGASSPSRFVELFHQSRLKRFVAFLPFARHTRSRR
jgi:uncharacterized membrane protein YbhN (UPF0104 family)